MLQYQIRRGKLASLSYRVGDVSYDLNYLKNTSAWNMLSTLILAGDVDGATELYKLGFSIAACDNWVRMSSGHWTVQYAGHVLYVRSTGTAEVFLLHANNDSRVSKDLVMKAAEIAYHIRRRWYDQKLAAQTARRDSRRAR
jgi:hypothetical protein